MSPGIIKLVGSPNQKCELGNQTYLQQKKESKIERRDLLDDGVIFEKPVHGCCRISI